MNERSGGTGLNEQAKNKSTDIHRKKDTEEKDLREGDKIGGKLRTVFTQQRIRKADPMRHSGITNAEKIFGSERLVHYCIISK